MNPHYDRYLVRKYAPLYRNRYGDMQSTAMCWGFSVGNGWFHIINELSLQLCRDWLSAKSEYDGIAGRTGKPFYADLPENEIYNKIITGEMIEKAYQTMKEEEEKVPVASQVKEKYGTLRFYIDGGTDEHYALISFAEGMSYRTCDVCGRPGKLNRNGWLSVRCKEHR